MNSQLEQLLNRQIELIARLQAKAEDILGWNTSPEAAEATAEYFQALESAVDSLDTLSDLRHEFKDLELEDDNQDG